MTDENIDRFTSFKETDLANVLPNDLIFEIGNSMFRIYLVPRDMTIETLHVHE